MQSIPDSIPDLTPVQIEVLKATAKRGQRKFHHLDRIMGERSVMRGWDRGKMASTPKRYRKTTQNALETLESLYLVVKKLHLAGVYDWMVTDKGKRIAKRLGDRTR
jgi:uncharacterized Fe-S cluster-containing radical SAM superfamily protein